MDARSAAIRCEIKELKFKFKSLRDDHEELKKRLKKLEEGK